MHFSPITFMCVVSLFLQRASSIDMMLRVKPGDNITLYCDLIKKIASDIVWFQCFSANAQTCTNVSVLEAYKNQVFNLPTSHLTPVWNAVNKSYDLVINSITESDRGLYYCASEEKSRNNLDITWSKVHTFSKDATWVSVSDTWAGDHVLPDAAPTSPSPSPWECGQSWVLLVSLCLACVLLSALISSTCVCCFCHNTDRGKTESVLPQTRADNKNRRQTEDGDMCYVSLNLPTVGRKQDKGSFTTYSEVRHHRR